MEVQKVGCHVSVLIPTTISTMHLIIREENKQKC